jgi:hypothetical protein
MLGFTVGIDIGRNKGSSRCGPRRLTKPISMPPCAGRRLKRSGAGVKNEKNHHRLNKMSPDESNHHLL